MRKPDRFNRFDDTNYICITVSKRKETGPGYEYISIELLVFHYNDVIMGAMASQITSVSFVYSLVYSISDRRKHRSPRHWPLCGDFTGGPVISPHKGPVTQKMFPFDDVIIFPVGVRFIWQHKWSKYTHFPWKAVPADNGTEIDD